MTKATDINARADAPKLRRMLLENGYQAIPIDGKAPRYRDWQSGEMTEARLAEIEAAHPDHTNTGICTGPCAAIDIDLIEPAHVEAVERIIADALGDTLFRRVGRKGCMLFYYNREPISKITISASGKRLIEFLGKGQQFAAYGTHPVTCRPYLWTNADLGFEPLQRLLADLPVVSPEKLRLCAQAICKTLLELGYPNVTVSEAGASSSEGFAPSHASGLPVSAAIIEALLRCIPPDCPRTEWLIVCGGLGEAPVNDPEWNGLDMFTRWSAGEFHGGLAPKNYKGEEDCAAEWRRDQEKRAKDEGEQVQ